MMKRPSFAVQSAVDNVKRGMNAADAAREAGVSSHSLRRYIGKIETRGKTAYLRADDERLDDLDEIAIETARWLKNKRGILQDEAIRMAREDQAIRERRRARAAEKARAAR